MLRRNAWPALCRSVFDRLPCAGRWQTALVADGNIGIGGDPRVLLDRLRRMLSSDGRVLVELDPPGSTSGPVRLGLETGDEENTLASQWLRWAHLSVTDIESTARAARMCLTETWRHHERWFAALTPIPHRIRRSETRTTTGGSA